MSSFVLLLISAFIFEAVISATYPCDCNYYRSSTSSDTAQQIGICEPYGQFYNGQVDGSSSITQCVFNDATSEYELYQIYYQSQDCTGAQSSKTIHDSTSYMDFNCESTNACNYAIIDSYANDGYTGDQGTSTCNINQNILVMRQSLVIGCCFSQISYYDDTVSGSGSSSCGTDSGTGITSTTTTSFYDATITDCSGTANDNPYISTYPQITTSSNAACLLDINYIGDTGTVVTCDGSTKAQIQTVDLDTTTATTAAPEPSCDCRYYKEYEGAFTVKPIGICEYYSQPFNGAADGLTSTMTECVYSDQYGAYELHKKTYHTYDCTGDITDTQIYYADVSDFNCESSNECDYALIDVYINDGGIGDYETGSCIKGSVAISKEAIVTYCCVSKYYGITNGGSGITTCKKDADGSSYTDTFSYYTVDDCGVSSGIDPHGGSSDKKPYYKQFSDGNMPIGYTPSPLYVSNDDACLQDVGYFGDTYTEITCPEIATTTTTTNAPDGATTTTKDGGTTRDDGTEKHDGTTTRTDPDGASTTTNDGGDGTDPYGGSSDANQYGYRIPIIISFLLYVMI